jgi:CMP-N-acetylneuraminic acid synthetase
MSNLVFIPVRIGSKGIKKKNIKAFNGKPLVLWSLLAAQGAEKVDQIILASDSEEINAIVKAANLSKVTFFNRSEENAADTSSTESVMLEYLQQESHKNEDAFILMQATSPLTRSVDIDSAISRWEGHKESSLISVVESKRFIWGRDGKPLNYDPFNRPRRQDFEGLLIENGALYIQSVAGVLATRNRLKTPTMLFEMPEATLIEIDTEEDWLIAEMLAKKQS